MRLVRSASRLHNGLRALPAARSISSIGISSSSHAPASTPRKPSPPSPPLPQQHRPLAPRCQQQQQARAYSSAPQAQDDTATPALLKTPLYDLHLAHGAKMVPFGGFHMPVQYAAHSVSASHIFTRTHASLFDVSHMVQRVFSGPAAAAFLQRVTPVDAAALPVGSSTLSALLHPRTGGIVDDTVITKLDAHGTFYVVTNAACRAKDDAYLAAELAAFDGRDGVRHEKHDHKGLVALQGPLSAEILAAVAPALDLPRLLFGRCATARIAGADVLVSRGGYTGEDGFELSIPSAAETVAVTEALLERAGPQRLRLAGLGARDSLRLEAGMCLYGHDLDDSTTPVEAGLGWIVPRTRRSAKAGFHGAEVIAAQLVPKTKGGRGVERRRVGLLVEGAPAREGVEIVAAEGDGEGQVIGKVTSGCPSPTLGKNIAMGYVRDGFHKAGTAVDVVVRGKKRRAIVSRMPFVLTNYWKGTAPA